MNLFIFEIFMDMLTTANECVHVWVLCMQNAVKHSFSPNEIIFINSSFIISWTKTSGLDTVILSRIKKEITWAFWTNSRPQYLTIPIKLIPIDHIPLRRAAMDSFCLVIIYAMSWTKRRSFSFLFWSSEAFFSFFVFSVVHPVFLSWTPPLVVANSSTSSILALKKINSRLLGWFEFLKFIFPASISVYTCCLRERQSSVECPGFPTW